jgi:outer membrane usher protein FimD/PapC
MNKLLLTTAILLTNPALAQSESELFEKAFGKKEAVKTLSLPLLLDRASLGEMKFVIRGDKIISINGEKLRMVLAKSVRESLVTRIPNEVKVSVENLPREIQLKLYRESLFVEIKIPANYYEKQRTVYDNRPDILGKKVFSSQKYSHILNYWYEFNKNSGEEQRHELDIESAFNINGYVLENDFDFTQSERNSDFVRKSTRIVKDFVNKETRLQVGDIDFSTTNLQSQTTLLGLSYSKDYSLNPYKKIKPVNQFEFILAQRSYVTIYVNDRPVRSEILDKGRHSIEDLVLDYGRNSIRIVAKEVAGQTKEFEFSWSGASELLRKGLSLYSHNIGVKSLQGDEVEYEDFESLTYSGFYQYGLNSLVTGGLSAQLNEDHINVGPTLFASTGIGALRLETAFSKNSNLDISGVTIDSELENAYNTRRGDLRLSLGYQYFSPHYTSFDSIISEQKFLHNFRFDFSWYLNQWINFSLDANRSLARRLDLVDREFYSVGVGLSPLRDLRLNVNYGVRRSEFSELSHEVSAFLNYTFSGTGHHLNTFHDTENDRHTAQLTYTPEKKQDAFYYRAQAEKAESNKSSTLSAGYKSRYFDAETSVVAREGRGDDFNAKLRGAHVWSPGFMTLSPQVYNGFAFIKGKNSLEKKKIGLINDVGGVGSKEFRQKVFLPELGAYHYYPIYMDPTHLDHGTSYDYDHYYIYPTYKGVVNVELGKVKSHTVFGRFDSSKSGLKTGEFIRKDGYAIPFFTNRKGKFALESVLPGTYEIWLNGRRVVKGFEIKSDSETILNIGRIK